MTARSAPSLPQCPRCGGQKLQTLLPCHGFVALRCRTCQQRWNVPAAAPPETDARGEEAFRAHPPSAGSQTAAAGIMIASTTRK